jgi:dihydroneopterin aldolase
MPIDRHWDPGMSDAQPPNACPEGLGNGVRRIFVRDLMVAAHIGALRHEKDSPQRVRLNLELFVAEDVAEIDDRLENVLSYQHIVEGARALAQGPHINLVETMAEQIATFCLNDARVRWIRVRVEKLDIYTDAESVGVEIERKNTMPPPRSR